jgi:hypothetical protein
LDFIDMRLVSVRLSCSIRSRHICIMAAGYISATHWVRVVLMPEVGLPSMISVILYLTPRNASKLLTA